MTKSAGRLKPNQVARAKSWIRQRAQNPCSACGRDKWIFAEHLVMPPRFSREGGVALGGTVYPQCMVICSYCGLTRFHNAALMGISVEETPLSGAASEERANGDAA